jgi:hypothetical protein
VVLTCGERIVVYPPIISFIASTGWSELLVADKNDYHAPPRSEHTAVLFDDVCLCSANTFFDWFINSTCMVKHTNLDFFLFE